MKLFSEVLSFISIYFGMYVMVYGYNVTMKERRKIDLSCLIVIALITFSTLVANNLTGAISRLFISFLSVFLGYLVIFRERLDLVLFKTFIIFLLLNLCEIIFSPLYIVFPINFSSKLIMESISYFRTLNTILVALILFLLFLLKPFRNVLNKLFNYMNKKVSYIFLFVVILASISFLVLTYFNSVILDIESFIVSILLIIFFLVLCIIMIYQYFKNKHNEEEQKNLLELMNDYEVMLDNDRISRHEMLNNLVALKSYKNKASKDFEDMLDGIIKNYEDKKSKIFSNLYKLPSGIKGVVYYKLNTIRSLNIDFNLMISKEVEDKFEKLNQKLYFKVCKILGIILDNSIEAADLTKDKILLVDIYFEESTLVIYVENSFINAVDLDNIYDKGFSSKGKNRGYGLYLVKKIVNETNELKFEQSISDDRFITIIKIKNPS